ncbi:unnamed protein product, partial [Schistosoma turkestanicum]
NLLKPPSEPAPTIPLNKLMSNTSVMDDYFGHYKMTRNPQDHPSPHPLTPHTTRHSAERRFIESNDNIPVHVNDNNNEGDDDDKDDDDEYGVHLKQFNRNTKLSTLPFTSKTVAPMESSKGIVRRRTLPGFLTHPPLDLNKFRKNLTILQENGLM